MSEMVGRIATCLREELRRQAAESGDLCDDVGGLRFDGHIDADALARSLIAAMREPTRPMVDSTREICVGFAGTQNIYCDRSGAEEVWQAMIDEALK